jgi:CRP/FNR family cyclic AMP-dependent transcriptional regulator
MEPSGRSARFDRDAVAAAIAASNLRDVPADLVERLEIGARVATIAAGSTLHPEGETRPHFELVVAGLVRVYVGSPDGRTLTVRYCRPGAIIGAASVFGRGFSLPATIQAIVDSKVLVLGPSVVRATARAHQPMTDAVMAELSERIQEFILEIQQGAFAPVRQRVARHVLDLASESQRRSALVANVSQAELAAACGTVREVVARVLHDLRGEGIIETRRAGVVVVDPAAMLEVAFGEGADGD